MAVVVDGEILKHQQVAPGHYRIGVHAPAVAQGAKAGQFCMVQVAEGLYPFLRRPMSFERILNTGVTILFKAQGEGTRMLARMQAGQHLSMQGPLGVGFSIDVTRSRHIIVAGGIGVAPCVGLAEAIVAACGKAPEVIIAARTKDLLLCEEDFRWMGCKIHIATDDGSAGVRALAPEALEQLAPGPDSQIYACGPMAMMKAAAVVSDKAGAACQVSLEARMACGAGVCLSCVVETTHEREYKKMLCACTEGPVFDAKRINWQAQSCE